MQEDTTLSTLQALGCKETIENLRSISDGRSKLLRGESGQFAAVTRHGQAFDLLLVGADTKCPVETLREFLEFAVLPMSQEYAVNMGVASHERKTLRTHIQEAAVSLDVLVKGQRVRVRPADMTVPPEIHEMVRLGTDTVTDELAEDTELIRNLQSCMFRWRRELYRLSDHSRSGPGDVLSVEEEIMFWSSLKNALYEGRHAMALRPLQFSVFILGRKRLAQNFFIDMRHVLEASDLRVDGALKLVQGLPIIPLRSAITEDALLQATNGFWEHMNTKLPVSSLPMERTMGLTHSLSAEVSNRLKAIQKERGGLLNVPLNELNQFMSASNRVFDAWVDCLDKCQSRARSIAIHKGDKVPVRKAPAFETFRTRIDEAFDFRSHKSALESVLKSQMDSNPSLITMLGKLQSAFEAVVRQCDSGYALDTSDAGVQAWSSACNEYSAATEEIEEAIAEYFHETVCGFQNLTLMSRYAADYSQLLDKPFMENATSICTPTVLAIVNPKISGLRKQWDIYRPSKKKKISFRHLPSICTSVVQARAINGASQSLLDEMRSVLGSMRMGADPDVCDFKEKLDSLQKQTDPIEVFRTWSQDTWSTVFRLPITLIQISETEDQDLSVGIGNDVIDVLRAVFFFEQDDNISTLLNRELLTRARDSHAVLQAFTLIKSSLENYSDACALTESIDDDSFLNVLPLVTSKQQSARNALRNASSVTWATAARELIESAEKCCSSCQNYVTTLRALIDEHRFITETLTNLSMFCLKPDIDYVDDYDHVKRLLRQMNSTLKSIQERVEVPKIFEEYLKNVIGNGLECAMDSALERTIRHWISESELGRVSVFKADLRLSTLGDQFLLDPEVDSIHTRSVLSVQNLIADIHSLFLNRDRIEAGDPMGRISVPSLSDVTRSETKAQVVLSEAMEYIKQELSKMQDNAEEWSGLTYVFSLDKGLLRETVSKSPTKAREVYQGLCSAQNDLVALEKKHATDGKATSIYLQINSAMSMLTASVAAGKRDVLDACSSFCAAQSHEIFKLITTSKMSIKKSLGKSTMDIVLLLKSVEDNVFSAVNDNIPALKDLELGIGQMTGIRLPSTWISHDVLSAELQMLKSAHAEKNKSTLSDVAELKSKFREEKKSLDVNLANFHIRIGDSWKMYGSSISSDQKHNGSSDMNNIESCIVELKEDAEKLRNESSRMCLIEKALNFENSSSDALTDSLAQEVETMCNALITLKKLSSRIHSLGNSVFESFDARTVRKDVEDINSQVSSLETQYGPSEALLKIQDTTVKHLRMHGLLSRLRDCTLSPLRERDLLETIFKERNPAASINQKKVCDFWHVDLFKHESYLREVFHLASGESALAEFMNGVKRTWSARQPVFIQRDGIKLLDGIPMLVDELHDQLQELSTMEGSEFVSLFQEERKSWEVRLARCQEVLEQIVEVQMQWLHLHSLFGAGAGGTSLRKKLAKEFIAFSNVDSQIATFFDDLKESAGLVEGLNSASGLDRILSELHEIVRSLSKFLENQRAAFPRFFFMADPDLLLVLSMTPARIETLIPSMGKLFSGIGQLEYKHSDGVVVSAVFSKEGERVSLCRPVLFSEATAITEFLSDLEQSIIDTLQSLLKEALKACELLVYFKDEPSNSVLSQTIECLPIQILLLASRILFTEKVEKAFKDPSGTHDLHKELTLRLSYLCSCSLLSEGNEGGSDLISTKREHIIKDLVYQRDTIQTLVDSKVNNLSAHEWNHQLRFYVKKAKTGISSVVAKCSEATFEYGWEYLGVGDTLVQTPLTSRCYLTLTHALNRGFGGSPFGPAGTGKTETVKSLGRLLGRCVVVFNCDENFDSVSVGRILAGVSRVSFWVCFDEFNRLSASSLSATSQQLSILQNAVKNGLRSVPNFYGGDVPISIGSGLGIFITTNPSYSGRRELPSNLKSLFRPCAMSKPDYLVIAEVLLMSYSFHDSFTLGSKLVHLFNGMKKVCRARPHYDFGLRSLKSAIVIAGYWRKHILLMSKTATGLSNSDEELAVVFSLHESLKPRLLPQDVSEYNSYVHNLFPSASQSTGQLPEELQKAICSACKENTLRISASFLEHIAQLYNLLKHRPGVMLVGEAGCGKSTTWKILFEALRRLHYGTHGDVLSATSDKNSSLSVLDPKLLTHSQLYGSLDITTREWTDGVFTKILRDCADRLETAQNSTKLHWIVFDGDIDPNWVENLNSVLDDTRLLTLPSGERIPLSPNIRILFEVDSLKYANPSTVSRCGLVYFDEMENLADILSCHLDTVMSKVGIEENSKREVLKMTGALCSFTKDIATYGNCILKQPLCSFVSGIATMFSSLLIQVLSHRFSESKETSVKEAISDANFEKTIMSRVLGKTLSLDILALCFLFSSKTIIGSGFSISDEVGLYSAFLERMKGCSPCLDRILAEYNGEKLVGSLFDVKSCTSYTFSDQAAEPVVLDRLPDQIGSPDIVIPTPSSTRLTQIVRDAIWNQDVLQDQESLTILCGPPGCGKSMVLTSALNEMPGVELATISMSSRTTIKDVIAVLKAHMELVKGLNGDLILRPAASHKQTVLFCDEVNLGEPDEYGTQHVANFLRCLVENHGFWSGTPVQWTKVEGLRVVAACNPAEDAGRHHLPSRLMRHAILVRVEQPDQTDLMTIFNVHITALLNFLDHRLERQAEVLTKAMVEFFLTNKEKFAPDTTGPLEPHYVYSARELIRWVRGMKRLLIKSKEETHISVPSRAHEKLWDEVLLAFSHEAKRLFIDRLVSDNDSMFGETSLAIILRDYFGYRGKYVPDILYSSWWKEDNDDSRSEVFEKISDIDNYRGFLYRRLRVFAEEEGLGGAWVSGRGVTAHDDAIDQFAVTDDVLRHLARIERALSLPLGHAVLMGVPGTGKKTLARFAAWMLGATVFQVRSHASYTAEDFANDLRSLLKKAGVYHLRVVVIFDESNDLDSAFLEMMNSILACGDVPGLFEGDERTALLKEIHDYQRRTAVADMNNEALYSKFLEGVRENLHVIFSIPLHRHGLNSSEDEDLKVDSLGAKNLTSRSPALYNRCVVDWFGDWNSDTLESIAELKVEVAHENERPIIAHVVANLHSTTQKYIEELPDDVSVVTPRHYLEFIEQLNRISLENGRIIEVNSDRLGSGLNSLRKAGESVDTLRDALKERTAHLQQKEAEANNTLRTMSEEQRLAEKSKLEAEKLAVAADQAAEAARIQQEQVTEQLASVEPKVEAAREAVGSIRKENLEELRGMPNPPASVRAALDAVMLLLDAATQNSIGTYSWGQIRSRMRGHDFIASILNYDLNGIRPAVRAKIESKISHNRDFDVNRISYASSAAGPLAEWTVAVLDYAAVAETVEPLRDEVETLQAEEDELMQRSFKAKEAVSDLEKRIDEDRAQYALLVAEAERLRSGIKDSEYKVVQAENMLDSLSGEWDRWMVDLHKCDNNASTVWGNAIYASAFVAYAGPLDHEQRKCICTSWCELLNASPIEFDENDISLPLYLTSPEDRSFWTSEGLPVDGTSLENYAILLRSARYPLIVDPSGKAVELLRAVLGLQEGQGNRMAGRKSNRSSVVSQAPSKLSITSFASTGKKSYVKTVESAVRFGTSVLVDNAERFDNTVLPLLGQESCFETTGDLPGTGQPRATNEGTTAKRSQKRIVRLGDRDVGISPGFRLFLSTAHVSKVPSAAVSRSSVVSFVMSTAALKSKCVSRTLTALQPIIEKQRTAYMITSVQCESRKKHLEDSLLQEISNTEDLGAELMGGRLFTTLENLKKESDSVIQQEKENKILAEEAKSYEKKYQNLANSGLRLFHILDRLQSLNTLYRFSPSEFFALFDTALLQVTKTGSNPAPSPTQIHRELVRTVYLHVVPSLFPQHKIAFACALVVVAAQFNEDSNEFCFSVGDIRELRAIIGTISQNNFSIDESVISNSKLIANLLGYSKLPVDDANQFNFANIITKPLYNVLTQGCKSAGELPKLFDDLGISLPGGKATLHGMSTRADVVLSSLMKSIANNESNMYRPCLLCSRGANSDPCELTSTMARQLNVTIESIALNNEHTSEVIGNILSIVSRRSAEEPMMLLMKNMHLASRKCIERLKREICKNQQGLPYLLVMAAEVTSGVPQNLADLAFECRVLAFEVPSSLRTNLGRCHAVLNARFNGVELLQRTYIAVTWLHGALLERRQYSPIGFSKPYAFSEGDLTSAWETVMSLYMTSATKGKCSFLQTQESVTALVHLLSISVYGGRVEHQVDFEVLYEFVSDLFNRVLIRDAANRNVSVVDSMHAATNVIVPVDDPLMTNVADELPLLAPTDWFGMPPKTSESYKVREGRHILDVFLALIPSQVSPSSSQQKNVESADLKAQKRCKVEELLKLLPQVQTSSASEIAVDSANALHRFVKREEELCVECILYVRSDLQNMLSVLDGNAKECVRIGSLLKAANIWDIHGSNTLPAEWERLSKYVESQKTIRALFTKLSSSFSWLREENMYGTVMNISFALRPNALICALGQVEAVRLGIPENNLRLAIAAQSEHDLVGGWKVSGLMLEGGAWEDEKGYVSLSDGSPVELPPVVFWWGYRASRSAAAKKNGHSYALLPIYDCCAREQLVTELFVPIDPSVSMGKWRLSATAIVISAPEE